MALKLPTSYFPPCPDGIIRQLRLLSVFFLLHKMLKCYFKSDFHQTPATLMSELTVHDVTLQLENLWDRHGENYHIKLLRGSCFPGDLPLPIPQGDVGHLLLVGHLGTCVQKAAAKHMQQRIPWGKCREAELFTRGKKGNGFPPPEGRNIANYLQD